MDSEERKLYPWMDDSPVPRIGHKSCPIPVTPTRYIRLLKQAIGIMTVAFFISVVSGMYRDATYQADIQGCQQQLNRSDDYDR